MKKILLISFLSLSGMLANAQIVNIPDANFKNHLLSMQEVNTNGDGEIQVSEALAVQGLEISEHPDLTGPFASFEGIEAFSNLTYLGIHSTITSLDISGFSQLEFIGITDDQLVSLNLAELNNLKSLSFSSAFNLSSLNVSALPNLKTIHLDGADSLTSLTIGNNSNFEGMYLNTRSLENLDLSGCPNISWVNMTFNTDEHDVFVNLKNGNAYNAPNSSAIYDSNWNDDSPHRCFVCMDEGELEGFEYLSPGVIATTYCSFTPGGNYNTIAGSFSFDAENNGCDSNDIIDGAFAMHISDGAESGTTYSNNGNYSFYTGIGNFVVTPVLPSGLFTVTPPSATINFADTDNNTLTQNFCLTANGVHNDAEVVIVPVIPAQPGFDAFYKIIYKNKGNQILSGDVTFTYNDDVLDYISGAPSETAASEGSLIWNYSGLQPFETREILVTFNVNGPMETPAVNLDDVLTFTAAITPTAGDETTSDNTFELKQIVVGSFDPNDITCLEGDVVLDPLLNPIYLHYNINFENTGTAPATFIVVKDEINEDEFDISSLQVISASHNVETRVAGNKVEFIFDNINLAGGGKGNVVFKIKTLNTLVVTQKANIYFDYNWPIQTNDATTVFAVLSNDQFQKDESVKVYPNPAIATINLTAASEIQSVQLYDAQGRVMETIVSGNENTIIMDVSNRASGLYFIKVITEQGSKVEKFLKK